MHKYVSQKQSTLATNKNLTKQSSYKRSSWPAKKRKGLKAKRTCEEQRMSTAASDGAGNVIGSTGEGGADGGPPPGLQHSHPQSAVVAVPPQRREPPAGAAGADPPVA